MAKAADNPAAIQEGDVDADLISRCKRELPHNLDAYRELVEKYEGLVFGTCQKMLGSRPDAEEVTQDAFLRVFHKLEQFEGRSAFKTWLFRIVYNDCMTRRKKLAITRERRVLVEEEQVAIIQERERPTSPAAFERDENVRIALSQLKEDEEKIICLRFISDLSLDQMAEVLDMGLSATKMRLYRAMEKFKAVYTELLAEKSINPRGILKKGDKRTRRGDAA